MKKACYLLLILLPVAGFSQSPLGKFKQKVKDRVEQRTDEGMDKALDETENRIKGKKTKKEKPGPETTIPAPAKEEAVATTSFQSYSHYDFISGEQIVYAEDFSQDVIGEFPLKWSTNNHGQTVTISGQPGNWMRLFKEGHFVSPYIHNLPGNYTVEFDAVLHLPENIDNTSYPEFIVRLMNVPADDEKARAFFNDNFDSRADVKITLKPYTDDRSMIGLESTQGGYKSGYFTSEDKVLPKMGGYLDKPAHFALWIQKERFRLWINGEKVYDLPQALPENAAFNRMEFETGVSSYSDELIGYHISNIRVAQGAPDMRSKLLTEGKLVTTGILFDINSAKIKPESFGVLQEIAKVLKENPTVRIRISGHTDSDGDTGKNLTLSAQRAASVRQALAAQFGIDDARMETDGKGETQPVADNSTKEGKAQNRRVEFIKL